MGFDAIFGFEQDFSKTFQCIPMAVRYRLDLCGIKLSLSQWKRFTDEDRCRLLLHKCETSAEIAQFRDTLAELISSRAGETPRFLPQEPGFAWQGIDAVPEQVTAYARSLDIPPPSLAQWQALSVLQRFTLLKLSQQNHDNRNFIPALKEFGLLTVQPGLPLAKD